MGRVSMIVVGILLVIILVLLVVVSCLYCLMRNLDQMTIGKTHPSLFVYNNNCLFIWVDNLYIISVDPGENFDRLKNSSLSKVRALLVAEIQIAVSIHKKLDNQQIYVEQ